MEFKFVSPKEFPRFKFNNAGKNVEVAIQDQTDFEQKAGISTKTMLTSLLDGLDTTKKVHIKKDPLTASPWHYINIIDEQDDHKNHPDIDFICKFKGIEKKNIDTIDLEEIFAQNQFILQFPSRPNTQKLACYEHFNPKSDKNLNLKNLFKTLQSIDIRYFTTRVLSTEDIHYFAEACGTPGCLSEKHPFTMDSTYPYQKIRNHMSNILKKHWNNVSRKTRNRIQKNIERINFNYIAQNPTHLRTIATEPEEINGETIGLKLCTPPVLLNTIEYLWDFKNPEVMNKTFEYLDSKIKEKQASSHLHNPSLPGLSG